MDTLAIQILNSIFYAAVLFLISAGLSLIYGVMRIVNLGAWDVLCARRLRLGLGRRRGVRRRRSAATGVGRAAAAAADRRVCGRGAWAR